MDLTQEATDLAAQDKATRRRSGMLHKFRAGLDALINGAPNDLDSILESGQAYVRDTLAARKAEQAAAASSRVSAAKAKEKKEAEAAAAQQKERERLAKQAQEREAEQKRQAQAKQKATGQSDKTKK